MSQFFRAHRSIILTLSVGITVGVGVTLLIQKLRRSLSHDLGRLVEQIESLRHDLEVLRDQLEQHDSPQHERLTTTGVLKKVPSQSQYFSAASSDEDDEFQEAYGGSDDNSANHSESVSPPRGRERPQSPLPSDLQNVLSQADRLLDGNDTSKAEAYQLLQQHEHEYSGSVEMLWRLCKATYFMSQIEGAAGRAEKKKNLVYRSHDIAKDAVQISTSNSNVHKWFAITVGSLGDFEGTQVKIQNGYTFREHIEKAVSLDPKDPSCHYLLGRWCYGVYMLSWLERQAAAALFATPPSATVEEALQHFLQAEELNPNKWKENLLYIGKCYLEKREYYAAVDYLQKANKVETVSVDDKTSQTEVDNLLYQYSGYRR